MTRTFGQLHHSTGLTDGGVRAVWCVSCEPHVAIRFKRLFARVSSHRTGVLTVTDTPDVALDLEWFLTRYPLAMSDRARARLTEQANRRREQDQAVQSILGGQLEVDIPEGMEPARPLYDFQRQAADLVLASKRLLLTDDVGLGKTTSALGVLRHPDALPAAFVTLTHLPDQMRDEMSVVLPWLTGHVVTRGQPYELAAARGMAGRDPDVVFLPYSKLATWAPALAGKVRTVIFDEVQELRRDQSLKYAAAGQIADAATYVMGLTATPVYNYGGEMFNVMSIVAPDALGTREEFTREWGAGVTTSGQIRVREPGSLGHYLTEQGLMLGRTRTEVGREIPPVNHVAQVVAADGEQLDAMVADVADLAALLLDPAAEGKQRFLAAGEIDYRMRHATGVAKAPFVAEFLKLLLESEDKIVVYVWHRDVYDVLMARLRDYRPAMYSGSESPTQKRAAKAAFLHPSDRGGSRVLLMSLRAGAGLDGLQHASSCVVFAELDWSPGIHTQAIGRVARDGQPSPVMAYFLHSEDGSDPAVMEVLNVKAMQAEPMVRPGQEHTPAATASDGDRARRLAAAALHRAGRIVPGAAADGGAQAADIAALFADVAEIVDRQPQPGQIGLFE